MRLRENQLRAVNTTTNNNFKSGVHFHATGTGKSWISLEIILNYNNKYNNRNIIWMCEQKSILIEQFNKKTLKEKGYLNIYNKFMIVNYTENKNKDWSKLLGMATFWGKPVLLVINRSFLVSQKKYKNIKIPISLIIHDECHSISNKTTREFYDYILEKNKNISCLGFSATPNLEFKPFNNILTSYSIYDAYCDNVILNPNIKWLKSNKILSNEDILSYCKYEIEKLAYKKVIVWCGMINLCITTAKYWKKHFPGFKICVDTSKEELNYNNYADFSKEEKNALLFCACKHREGSDIKNLDCCIFLDKVENRNAKTFVQCIGRVLRRDKINKKKEGVIIDLCASNCLKICDRMNNYLNCKSNFPWKYTYTQKIINKKLVFINQLKLVKNPIQKAYKEKNYTIEDLRDKFIKTCPNNDIYNSRLEKELTLIEDKKLTKYLIRAIEILNITNYIPHVTRGSCGSSLVCYLLGISNVDPIKHNIKFERFLNIYRDKLPDIDLDFPHYLRDEVFLKLELKWPNQVARISNHVHWHEKSALREALRRIGINKQISKNDIHQFVKKLPEEKQKQVEKIQNELNNTFRHYSLHCGGIVFFHDGIPKDLIFEKVNQKKTLTQIIFDKNDISKHKNVKIDILSSRGISQLIGICGRNIDFTDCPYDKKTYDLLQSGNNIGITLAESPLMRKALMKIKPKNITDIAICLAIIRPAAKDARIENNNIDYNTKFIFDDDAITILANTLNISNDLADKFRRCIGKDKWDKETKDKYKKLMNKIPKVKQLKMKSLLGNLREYSFCKSHSYSYAQLVYKIAYQKAHNPCKFWKSTLKNCSSSYRKWVHLYEARRNGVNVMNLLKKKNDVSIYAESRRKKFDGLSKVEQLTRFGYWDMTNDNFFPNCYFYEKENGVYYFGGIIASLKVLDYKTKTIVTSVGVGKGKFIEVITKRKYYNNKHYGLRGRATLISAKEKTYSAYIAKYY